MASVKREKKRLTTAFGIPVGDDQNSETAGTRGIRSMRSYRSSIL
jgi:catalase